MSGELLMTRPIRVFIAAPFSDRREVRGWRGHLHEYGLVCDLEWADRELAPVDTVDNLRDLAMRDRLELESSDVFIADRRAAFSPERVAVDQLTGYALAKSIPVIVIGIRQTVFDVGCDAFVSGWNGAFSQIMRLAIDREDVARVMRGKFPDGRTDRPVSDSGV